MRRPSVHGSIGGSPTRERGWNSTMNFFAIREVSASETFELVTSNIREKIKYFQMFELKKT